MTRPLPLPRRAHVGPLIWPCAPRHSSTLSIASLLRKPAGAPAPSAQQAPAAHDTLTINGFVQTVRKQKRVAFAAIGDGSSLQTVQAVLSPEQAASLSTGVAVSITGRWASSRGHEQPHELQATSVRVLGHNDAAANPLQKKYQTNDFLRALPHLRSRLPFNALLLRLRSQVTAQLTAYFAKHDFIQVHPPVITSSDCEGAGEVFTVSPAAACPSPAGGTHPKDADNHFFQAPKYLTVSNQLHLEALASSVSKVWTLSPTFRAEKSDTPRHLSEFYMLEAEIAFVEDSGVIMDVVEDMLRSLAHNLASSTVGQELLDAPTRNFGAEVVSVSQTLLARRWEGLMKGPWPRITYHQALQHLQDAVSQGTTQFQFAPDGREGLQTEHERFLAETLGEGGPIFVTDYPSSIKPFYMAPSVEAEAGSPGTRTVACFDLLVPEVCELVGGSMREHRLPELSQAMAERGLGHGELADSTSGPATGSLEWYLDLRRFGSVPHGGFGLGFDRLLCYLSGVSNIRDVVSFPRWHKRCDC